MYYFFLINFLIYFFFLINECKIYKCYLASLTVIPTKRNLIDPCDIILNDKILRYQ